MNLEQVTKALESIRATLLSVKDDIILPFRPEAIALTTILSQSLTYGNKAYFCFNHNLSSYRTQNYPAYEYVLENLLNNLNMVSSTELLDLVRDHSSSTDPDIDYRNMPSDKFFLNNTSNEKF